MVGKARKAFERILQLLTDTDVDGSTASGVDLLVVWDWVWSGELLVLEYIKLDLTSEDGFDVKWVIWHLFFLVFSLKCKTDLCTPCQFLQILASFGAKF